MKRAAIFVIVLAILVGGIAIMYVRHLNEDRTPTVKKIVMTEDKDVDKYNLTFRATPPSVAEKMLELAKVTDKDIVFDLGCGDGIMVAIAAKKYGCKAIGIDIYEKRVKEARQLIKKYAVEELVEIRHGDGLKVKDFDRATVVVLYMFPGFLNWLEPIAKKTLKPGTRIVSNDYKWETDWKPDMMVDFKGPERIHKLHLWTVK